MLLDTNQLIIDIKNAATGILQKDISTVSGFSDRQVTGIANQAKLVATGIASGEISGENMDFFLDQLVSLAQNFTKVLIGLLMVTLEKVWNAIVKVVWKAISTVTGAVLPLPNIS